ncbi:uncharacterized protein [Lepeophtheirus salmonis]|uniref:uncharacterized protein isoform X2 n=1 Tax=Lepeophtheirus salmonis TaxID=72036 RepID=UPI003AF34DA6
MTKLHLINIIFLYAIHGLLITTTTAYPSYVDGPPEDAILCPLAQYTDANGENVQEYFQCPGLDDPKDYKSCCEEKCCPYTNVDSILQIDIRIAMFISLAVITLCIISGITIIICCFVSSCPLYDTCSGDASWGSDGDYVPGDMHPLTLNVQSVLFLDAIRVMPSFQRIRM